MADHSQQTTQLSSSGGGGYNGVDASVQQHIDSNYTPTPLYHPPPTHAPPPPPVPPPRVVPVPAPQTVQQKPIVESAGAPARQYLNEFVTPHLLEGMKMLAKEQPGNPLEVLGKFLLERAEEIKKKGKGGGGGDVGMGGM